MLRESPPAEGCRCASHMWSSSFNPPYATAAYRSKLDIGKCRNFERLFGEQDCRINNYVMLCIFFVRGAKGPEKSPTGAQDVLS
ncbi:Glycoside hydrolase family 18 protein [Fusarium oxysporum f. sp. albedinis]|nr:Glycoside hydrolase family 18 protein [Fusarium oxysporum f. sp. albedinis]